MSKDGGAAFPCQPRIIRPQVGETVMEQGGMSLRDYFAAHAPNPPEWWKCDIEHAGEFFRWRWHYADAMLAAREAEEGERG